MWNLTPTERLRFWQNFRSDVSQLGKDQAICQIEHLWSYCPYVRYYLTTDNTENWPGPWELIYDNEYCDLAIALGIVYTYYLSDHGKDSQIEIKIYKNRSTGEQCNTVFIDDGKYVLNLVHDTVVNKTHIDSNLQLVRTITSDELRLKHII
jgi:hypothetical protein